MARQVIFSGAPSQVINIPAFLKGGVVIALVCAIHLYASDEFPLQWRLVLIQALAVMLGVGLPFLKTALTEIVIDTERITWTQGILRRRVSSLDLSLIRGVTTVHPWWQRLFGTGSVILKTSDPAHPVRRLPGIRNAEQLRRRLEEVTKRNP